MKIVCDDSHFKYSWLGWIDVILLNHLGREWHRVRERERSLIVTVRGREKEEGGEIIAEQSIAHHNTILCWTVLHCIVVWYRLVWFAVLCPAIISPPLSPFLFLSPSYSNNQTSFSLCHSVSFPPQMVQQNYIDSAKSGIFKMWVITYNFHGNITLPFIHVQFLL